jgi:uncharacterized protein YdhG (YjbR/CyaY superfamily)
LAKSIYRENTMPEKKPANQRTQKPTKRTPSAAAFTEDERAAMREYVREKNAARRRGSRQAQADLEPEVLAKIASMPLPDRTLGERLHAIVKASAPSLSPKLWYGMPAYANQDGQVVCFYQNAQKFKTRYGTLGFSDKARLDDGHMWPTSFALTGLSPTEETRIAALLKKAVT